MRPSALLLVLAACQPPKPAEPAPKPEPEARAKTTTTPQAFVERLESFVSTYLEQGTDLSSAGLPTLCAEGDASCPSAEPALRRRCVAACERYRRAAGTFPGPLTITFVDVGQGDAILVDAGDAEALIDTGGNGHWKGALEDALAAVDGSLELLFLTHGHEDHVAQTDEVLGLLEVQRVITHAEGPSSGEEYWAECEAALEAEGVEAEPAVEEETYKLAPGVVFEVYASGGGSDSNDGSLVLLLTYAGRKVLFTGDIQERGGRRLVRDYCGSEGGLCAALKSDVLEVPHHGAAEFAQELFDRVQPSYAVISAGFHDERHCLPRDHAYQALALLGAKIFSTSAEGTRNVSVTISSDGNMQWDYPDEPVFVWEGTRGKKCVGPLVYEQGAPRPYVAE